MGFSHLFRTVQMAPNRVKRYIMMMTVFSGGIEKQHRPVMV